MNKINFNKNNIDDIYNLVERITTIPRQSTYEFELVTIFKYVQSQIRVHSVHPITLKKKKIENIE